MNSTQSDCLLLDQEPTTESFLDDVFDGLSKTSKTLPCKYFYDQRGSQLFDQICDLPEYYPTRVEQGILESDQPSTIVDLTGSKPYVLRQGDIELDF